MFTEEQMLLICKLEAVGFGWAKFATSVRNSGQCTPKLEETLKSMVRRIEHHYGYSSHTESCISEMQDEMLRAQLPNI